MNSPILCFSIGKQRGPHDQLTGGRAFLLGNGKIVRLSLKTACPVSAKGIPKGRNPGIPSEKKAENFRISELEAGKRRIFKKE